METKAITYFGGVPTAPQVRKLMEWAKDSAPGDSLELSAIAELTGEDVRSNRFRTIVDVFRRALLRDRNFVTERIAGMGTIRILLDSERTGFGARGIRQGSRKVHRSVGVIAATPTERLTDAERDTNFHVRRLGEAIVATTRTAMKEIAQIFAAPPKQLPRSKTG
jgi:hypothetical protein